MKQLLTYAWLSAISAAVAVLAVRSVDSTEAAPAAPVLPTSPTFDRLTVHRIDVVEPNGKPRVILSNADKYPGAYFSGKEYPHPGRERLGGLLFFNSDGTEAGGMGYANDTEDGHHSAGAILTMDQYNQNETMKLEYQEEDGKRGAGLVVFGDHPDAGLEPVVIANAELLAAKTPAEKAKAQAKLDKLVDTNVGHSSKRVFVGREQDDALVMLSDKQGTPRIVMEVDGKGEPSIQFFDAAGKPTKTYSASK
jgi:hypothetical protein